MRVFQQISLFIFLLLISSSIFANGGGRFRRNTTNPRGNSISQLLGRTRSQIGRWATNAINKKDKKNATIKNPDECADVLAKVMKNKPLQLLKLMNSKGKILRQILMDLSPGDSDKPIFKKFFSIYIDMLNDIGFSLATNQITLNDLIVEENVGGGRKNIKFGAFQISEWEKKIFIFHRRDDGGNNFEGKLRILFGQFRSNGGRTKLATQWCGEDAMIENMRDTMLKADKFTRAFTGKPGSYMQELRAIKLGLKGTEGDIRLGGMIYTASWDELERDVRELGRVKKYLSDERNADVRYQVRKEGRVFSEIVRHQTTEKGPNPANAVPKVIINEEIHNGSFFEDLFAPYLAEFFEILTKDKHNGGFVFNLYKVRKDHTRVLAVDVGQVLVEEKVPEMGQIRGMRRSLSTSNYLGFEETQWRELAEVDQNPELNGKAKNPLQLEGHLLSHLLSCLYSRIVERIEHLAGRWKRSLVNDPDLPLIFHAYNFALATELFKRMGDLVDHYDVFYETQTSFKNAIPMTPQRETSEDRIRSERWEIIQDLYEKLTVKKAEIMEKVVKQCGDFLGYMGYGELDTKKRSLEEALAETMETEMAMTLDNLELNWAVDCHVDDIEKCLFADNNDLDFKMPEMRLFNENKDQMSKVQIFLEWMYKKLNDQIQKMTNKFKKEGNIVKSYLLKKSIELLDEFRQLIENRITIADILVPFWTEFKEYVAKPAYEFVARSKLMMMFLGIRDIIKFEISKNMAQQFATFFDFNQTKFTEKMAIIDEKLDKNLEGNKAKAERKIAKSSISSIFKTMIRSVLKKIGVFKHFREHFRIERLPELRVLFAKLKNKFARKKDEVPSTAITARTGVRKQWHTKWGHKVVTTLAINAAYRSINIVVVQHGSAIRFAASTGFFLLTIVYMTAVLWFCRSLLWQITCTSAFLHCGHYISVAFAIMAAGIWMGVMIAVF